MIYYEVDVLVKPTITRTTLPERMSDVRCILESSHVFPDVHVDFCTFLS